MCDSGLSHKQIAERLEITPRQVGYAVNTPHLSPKKPPERAPILSTAQVDELEAFVCFSFENRKMSFLELAVGPFGQWGVSEGVIREALRGKGYTRHVAKVKPPISERNKAVRKQWALNHLSWTQEDWEKILWTDESWVTDGWHTRTWVTRKVSYEAL